MVLEEFGRRWKNLNRIGVFILFVFWIKRNCIWDLVALHLVLDSSGVLSVEFILDELCLQSSSPIQKQ